MHFSKFIAFTLAGFLAVSCPATAQKKQTSNVDPGTQGLIAVRGTKLRYVVEGNGTPCLVIGSSLYYPRTFSKYLKEHLKMFFVDMRWFAPERGDLPTTKFSLPIISEDIEQVRLALGLENPVLIGHSIHGSVAMEYAKKYPHHISSLIMIGSPNVFGNPTYDEATEEVWRTASEKRKQMQDDNWKRMPDRNSFSPAQLIIEEYCAMGPKYWYDSTHDARALWKDMIIHADVIHPLYDKLFSNYTMFGNIDAAPVPSLVIMGKYDYVVPAVLWERQKKVSHLTLQVFDKSGHTPQLEQSELFDRVVLDWLRKK